jgi:hypothetical protein
LKLFSDGEHNIYRERDGWKPTSQKSVFLVQTSVSVVPSSSEKTDIRRENTDVREVDFLSLPGENLEVVRAKFST